MSGHQFISNEKITGSLQITCPEISCELHHFPQEHCKVQTFFMYHGASCQSCVEDICHGSQVVPASLIGNTSQVQNLQKTDNSNEVTPNQKQTLRVVNYINKLWTLFGNNLRKAFKSGYSRTRRNQRMQGYGIVPVYAKGINTLKPKLHIKCPEIECHNHHQPKAHCMVHSYFIYHGRKCNGCIEDICLGSHTVVDFLIGKNDSKYAPSPEKLPLRDQGIGNRVIAGEWKPGHSQLPLLENHKHSSNEQITQESHQEFTDRIYGNWRPGPSQPPLHVIHIQNINRKINPETIFPDKHQEARGRLFSGVWRSRNPQPIVVEIGVQKSKEQLEWSRNPNFNRIENNIRNIDSQWNHKNKNGVQTNAHINSRHNSGRNWNPNSFTKVQTTLQNKKTSKTNKEGNIGVEQKQSSLTRKDGAIWQIRAKGKSFLQSLFHPAFFS
ncbi:uncharacterized protein [Mytilus edulis]|uniref:uncharacterized protein n=1 Tax=Mytilus edulis TaxID=6550 RepID=UPI0039EDF999